MSSTDVRRSPLRWAGSKRRLLPKLIELAPKSFKRYVEPFCGSMCYAIALDPPKALLGDINRDLIHFYRMVRWRPRLVSQCASAWPTDSNTYYALREIEAGSGGAEERAARFLYLNRFCFNGVYRTNRAGKFNVPRGTHTGSLPSEVELAELAAFLRRADLVCADFADVVSRTRRGDFLYLDPPYAGRGVRDRGEYGSDAFKAYDLNRLQQVLESASDRGVRVLLSYADTNEIRKHFDGWTVDSINVVRNVSGFSAGRGIASEVLIRNY